MGFLDDLIGYKDVRAEGTLMPRRATLNFIGATVVDDVLQDATRVTLASAGSVVGAVTLSASTTAEAGAWDADPVGPPPGLNDPAEAAAFAAASLVRLESSDGGVSWLTYIYPGTAGVRKTIVNVALAKVNMMIAPPGSNVLLPGGEPEYVLLPNGSFDIVWDELVERWRVLL